MYQTKDELMKSALYREQMKTLFEADRPQVIEDYEENKFKVNEVPIEVAATLPDFLLNPFIILIFLVASIFFSLFVGYLIWNILYLVLSQFGNSNTIKLTAIAGGLIGAVLSAVFAIFLYVKLYFLSK